MILWLDAQLPRALAAWIMQQYGIEVVAARELGHSYASDRTTFFAAKAAQACVMTKDQDFIKLLDTFGPPPQIIWLRCGNTTNRRLLYDANPQPAQWHDRRRFCL